MSLQWRVGEYHVENFGCRASQADGDAIGARLRAAGAVPAANLESAELIVVNTCSVTAEAERDARAYIRRVRRGNPQARIVVTGCYAQRAADEVAAIPGVDAVVGNSHKNILASIALDLVAMRGGTNNFVPLADLTEKARLPGSRPAAETPPPLVPFLLVEDIFAHSDFQLPPLPSAWNGVHPSGHRTRPSLKIQDGCGNRCTFCIIPSTRGNSRSLDAAAVLGAVREVVEADGKELVLSGINLGRWGRDLIPQARFEDLLEEIFAATSLPRLRLSSVEPMDWSDGLISLFARWSVGAHPRLARHAHMPLQSGSDRVLRRMHRRYRPWHYAERVTAVRAASPDAAIGADVMVGFPGETDAEFQESYDLIAALPLTYLHLFPFSARPGTPAWEMHRACPVAGVAVRERMAALRMLIGRKNLAFRNSFIGKDVSAVTLIADQGHTARGCSTALTDNFLPVELDEVYAANTLVSVRIAGLEGEGLSGHVRSRKSAA